MTRKEAQNLYNALIRARKFDEKIVALYPEQEMKCPVHLSIGQEGAAAGVCSVLTKQDVIFSTHRCHAHTMAKGGSIKAMFAELYGKKSGCASGRGGSMHFADPSVGHLGSSAIVGASTPLAVGAALGFKLKKKKNIAVAFFGDGAVEQGTFEESLHFASLQKLPVLFVCENNGLAVITGLRERQVNPRIAEYAVPYKIKSEVVDGNKPELVFDAAVRAIKYIRSGKGPYFLEVTCDRWSEHVGPRNALQVGVVTPKQFQSMKDRDCVKHFAEFAKSKKLLSEKEIKKIEEDTDREIGKAVSLAKADKPDTSVILKGV